MEAFGLDVVSSANNLEQTTVIQNFWSLLNLVLVFVGTAQAGLDYLNARVLRVIIESGNETISWKEQHKWGVFVFGYQAILIWAIFLAYFPWCLFGLPDWTCIASPLFAMVPISVMMVPLLPMVPWVFTFVKNLLGGSLPTPTASDLQWNKPAPLTPKDEKRSLW